MNKKTLIWIIAAVLAVLVLAVIFEAVTIFYLSHSRVLTPVTGPQGKAIVAAPPTKEQWATQIKTEYPIITDGTINFLDTKTVYKTTFTTSDGKVYTLYPSQPEAIYKSFGAKDGQKVEIRVKNLNSLQLEWTAMKPI